MPSRREWLRDSLSLFAAGSASAAAAGLPAAADNRVGCVPLSGTWLFRLNSQTDWREVTVPHTWQVEPANAEYMGVAWYRRQFEAPKQWAEAAVRLEFEAVFHSAKVWVNGREAGEHLRKGYTAFTLDIGGLLRFDQPNLIEVRTDNSFDEAMLPRGRSSDWTHDGGIYRPVSLLVTPKVFVERLEIDTTADGLLEVTAVVRNSSGSPWTGGIDLRLVDQDTGLTAFQKAAVGSGARVAAGGSARLASGPLRVEKVKQWHFDHPHLYRLTAALTGGGHSLGADIGFRTFETRGEEFYFNGERIRPMGAERMAGSHPEFGMAEPYEWLLHDHVDLKELNCLFTRIHWQQDRRVFDLCNRLGILIQSEVPTWGPKTFAGMTDQPSEAILNNGLEQLREMIARDRNHPSIVSWGLCNEIGGQNPPAYQFAKRMYEEAKALDPRRLRSYASNSLQKTPAKDVSALMDFIEWNEYYESWMGGSLKDLERNLEEVRKVFPGKPIVISEYGYCACTAERLEGDARRIEILRDHTELFRRSGHVAGLIFFCYNDYRTHIGDKGTAVGKQRVHGVVDLYGARKPSWEVLRAESSPVEAVDVAGLPPAMRVTIRTRKTIPAHRMKGYKLRAVLYGLGDIPLERLEAPLPDLEPGAVAEAKLAFREKVWLRVAIDVMRPTGYSAFTRMWRP